MAKIRDGGAGFTGRKPRQTETQRQAEEEQRTQMERARNRRDENRRKIITGAALHQLAASGDPEAHRMLLSLVGRLTRAQDRDAFRGEVAARNGWPVLPPDPT